MPMREILLTAIFAHLQGVQKCARLCVDCEGCLRKKVTWVKKKHVKIPLSLISDNSLN